MIAGESPRAHEALIEPFENGATCLASKPSLLPQLNDPALKAQQYIGLGFVFELHAPISFAALGWVNDLASLARPHPKRDRRAGMRPLCKRKQAPLNDCASNP